MANPHSEQLLFWRSGNIEAEGLPLIYPSLPFPFIKSKSQLSSTILGINSNKNNNNNNTKYKFDHANSLSLTAKDTHLRFLPQIFFV